MLANGSTAIDGLSGSGSGAVAAPATAAADGSGSMPNTIGAHRPRDVLDLLLAEILEGEIELVADLVAAQRRLTQIPPGSASASSRAAILTPSPKMSPLLDDDVAEIDADAELDAPLRRHAGIALRHRALHLDRASHGIDDAGELDEQAVAGGLDDAAAVLGDLGVRQLAP